MDSLHSFQQSPSRTQYEQPPWNKHFGMKSSINKQFPASSHHSIYDVTSLEDSQARPEHTRELCRRRSLLNDKIARTGHFTTTVQSPFCTTEVLKTEGNVKTTEGPGMQMSIVHDSLYSQGSVDLDGPQTARAKHGQDIPFEKAHFRVRRLSQTVSEGRLKFVEADFTEDGQQGDSSADQSSRAKPKTEADKALLRPARR